MKRVLSITQLVMLTLVSLAYGSGFISKATAEQDALNAVGGGTVVQAELERDHRPVVWDVSIKQPTAEYEVLVNATNGSIVSIRHS